MSGEFQHLFTPFKIGSIEVRNRIVFLPTSGLFLPNEHGMEQYSYYLIDRAKGGAGLVTWAALGVHPTDFPRGPFSPSDDGNIPRFKAVADAIHEHGAKILGQLAHTGRQNTGSFTQLPLWAPSPIPCPISRETPHEMGQQEIRELVQCFAKSASNLQAAGFDGAELAGNHGHLLQQFMSPWSNRRTDSYGGSLDNRLRLINEVIDAIRDRVGSKFVLGVRISGDELQPGGLTLDDMAEIAKRLEATGKVSHISVAFATTRRYVLDMSAPPGAIVFMAARLKQEVNLPVIASQRINDALLAEKILADGHADLIGMARALMSDPELPNKSKEGRLDDIRACVGCLQECRRMLWSGARSCTQNPSVGFEKEMGIGSIRPAATKKKVVVVGGGPAGMEAARVAALRGHEVVLYEKDNRLGGQVNIAALAPTRQEIGNVTRYLSRQLEKLDVKVHMGREATSAMVLAEKPDAIVVATGSAPVLLALTGADHLRVISVWDALQEKVEVGDRVVVVDDGQAFWQCCGTADFLAKKGKRVEIISRLYFVGADIPAESLAGLYQRLIGGGVVLSPLTVLTGVQDDTLICSHVISGEQKEIKGVDAVVMAVGNRACDDLYNSLEGKAKEVYAVGDCLAPRGITEAIREGHRVGRNL